MCIIMAFSPPAQIWYLEHTQLTNCATFASTITQHTFLLPPAASWTASADHHATVKVRPTHLHAHAQLPESISNVRLGPGTHGKRHTMVVKMDHHLWPQRTVTIIIENNTRSMINHSYWRVTAFYFIIKWQSTP